MFNSIFTYLKQTKEKKRKGNAYHIDNNNNYYCNNAKNFTVRIYIYIGIRRIFILNTFNILIIKKYHCKI
jgi:hypothetical protein